MPTYTIRRVTGDYRARQREANAWPADLYVEIHGDGSTDPSVCRSSAIVASNASRASLAAADTYAAMMAAANPHHQGGPRVHVAKRQDRGWGNLYYTAMPAILAEIGHVSHPGFIRWLDGPGVDVCALALVMTILSALPDGGRVALSIGHVGKTSSPRDRGAPAADDGDGDPDDDWEAVYAARVGERVVALMEGAYG